MVRLANTRSSACGCLSAHLILTRTDARTRRDPGATVVYDEPGPEPVRTGNSISASRRLRIGGHLADDRDPLFQHAIQRRLSEGGRVAHELDPPSASGLARGKRDLLALIPRERPRVRHRAERVGAEPARRQTVERRAERLLVHVEERRGEPPVVFATGRGAAPPSTARAGSPGAPVPRASSRSHARESPRTDGLPASEVRSGSTFANTPATRSSSGQPRAATVVPTMTSVCPLRRVSRILKALSNAANSVVPEAAATCRSAGIAASSRSAVANAAWRSAPECRGDRSGAEACGRSPENRFTQ